MIDGKREWETSGYIPASRETSNNVGEYSAFISILDALKDLNPHNQPSIIRGDSKLVIMQMFGGWRIRQGLYVPFAIKARKKLRQIRNVEGRWIPREQNSVADELSKRELIRRGVEFRIQPLDEEGRPT